MFPAAESHSSISCWAQLQMYVFAASSSFLLFSSHGETLPGFASLTIIASYIAVKELHLVVTHGSTVTPERLPRWDDNLMRTQAFLRRFGSYQHPLPWHVRTSPLHTTWTVHFYTSHLDLGALIRLAAVAKPLVKPMAQLSEHVPVINVRHIPRISCMYNADFEWTKSTHKQSYFGVGLEICRLDCKIMTHLRSQRLQPPDIF